MDVPHDVYHHDEDPDSDEATPMGGAGSCPAQVMREATTFSELVKSDKLEGAENFDGTYRPPILSPDIKHFKGFRFGDLDQFLQKGMRRAHQVATNHGLDSLVNMHQWDDNFDPLNTQTSVWGTPMADSYFSFGQ